MLGPASWSADLASVSWQTPECIFSMQCDWSRVILSSEGLDCPVGLELSQGETVTVMDTVARDGTEL